MALNRYMRTILFFDLPTLTAKIEWNIDILLRI